MLSLKRKNRIHSIQEVVSAYDLMCNVDFRYTHSPELYWMRYILIFYLWNVLNS